MSIKNRNLKTGGYTLLQMAMALMIVGIILAVFLNIYTQYEVEEKSNKTTDRVNNAIESIQKYRNVFGTFPCPAPMNITRANVTYGIASNYGRYLSTGAVPLVAGGCAEGICIEENTRNDIAGLPTYRVRVGAIPFRDMQLDESDTYDAYGSRLWYAVTEDMCNLTTYDETHGAIDIQNDQGETQTNPPKSAAFIVVSPGVNRVGGYSISGNVQIPCGGTIDSENCRDVSLAISPTASVYRSQFERGDSAATFYDDVVEFFSSSQTQLWRRTAPGSEDIQDLANNSIGIGESTPSATLDIAQSSVSTLAIPSTPTPGVPYKGDIITTNQPGIDREHGALRVDPAKKLMADAYCSEAGVDCFRPENIMGAGIATCPSGTYPVGIKSNAVTKNAEFDCAAISINCEPGKTFTGLVLLSGRLVPACTSSSAFASCAATTKTLCTAGDVALPFAPHGTVSAPMFAGDCRSSTYTCNNGTWVDGVPTGSCTNAVVSSGSAACNAVSSCWAGTYTSTTYSCAAAVTTFATDCTCTGCSQSVTATCPAPLTGSGAVTRYDYVCDPMNLHNAAVIDPMNPTGTVIAPSSCSCSLTPYNQFFNCPSGWIRDVAAPVIAPNNWPADINKGKYELINVDGSCTHVPSGTVNDFCSCNGADIYSTALAAPPDSCHEAKSGSRVINGVAYDWKYDVMKATVNMSTCTPNAAALIDAAQFDPLQTYWREVSGSYTSTVNAKPLSVPEVGDTCDCSTYAPPGSTQRACVKPNGLGKYGVYQCKCDR